MVEWEIQTRKLQSNIWALFDQPGLPIEWKLLESLQYELSELQ